MKSLSVKAGDEFIYDNTEDLATRLLNPLLGQLGIAFLCQTTGDDQNNAVNGVG
jgi:hypothetical protein